MEPRFQGTFLELKAFFNALPRIALYSTPRGGGQDLRGVPVRGRNKDAKTVDPQIRDRDRPDLI